MAWNFCPGLREDHRAARHGGPNGRRCSMEAESGRVHSTFSQTHTNRQLRFSSAERKQASQGRVSMLTSLSEETRCPSKGPVSLYSAHRGSREWPHREVAASHQMSAGAQRNLTRCDGNPGPAFRPHRASAAWTWARPWKTQQLKSSSPP